MPDAITLIQFTEMQPNILPLLIIFLIIEMVSFLVCGLYIYSQSKEKIFILWTIVQFILIFALIILWFVPQTSLFIINMWIYFTA